LTGRHRVADARVRIPPAIATRGAASRSAWAVMQRAMVRFLSHWELVLGGVLLLSMVVLAVLAPLLTPFDPRALEVQARLATASFRHPLGTDGLGRDLWSRLLYGGRVSLGVGFFGALLSALIGLCIGLAAPMNRLLDGLAMRILDGVMSIPTILLAIALVSVAGSSVQNVVLAITIVVAPRIARIIRARTLSLRGRPFIDAAVASGSSLPKIILRHLLPGVLPQLIVQASFVWGSAMLIESALSFIGAGTPPTTPSWGNIMADGKALWQIRPNLIFFPAAFLSIALLAVNLIAEGLRKVASPHASGHAGVGG
jgi:peptide/nickel transport system permease protein